VIFRRVSLSALRLLAGREPEAFAPPSKGEQRRSVVHFASAVYTFSLSQTGILLIHQLAHFASAIDK
jgi:hypothetical protein